MKSANCSGHSDWKSSFKWCQHFSNQICLQYYVKHTHSVHNLSRNKRQQEILWQKGRLDRISTVDRRNSISRVHNAKLKMQTIIVMANKSSCRLNQWQTVLFEFLFNRSCCSLLFILFTPIDCHTRALLICKKLKIQSAFGSTQTRAGKQGGQQNIEKV